MRLRQLGVMLVGLALASFSLPADAVTLQILRNSGGATSGAMCPHGSSSCFGTSPEFALTGVGTYGLMDGVLQYNPGPNPTMDIQMGNVVQIKYVGSGAGVTEVDIVSAAFDASGIPVTATLLAGSGVQLVQSGAVTGVTDGNYVYFPGPPSTFFNVTPSVSGLNCTLGTTMGQCTVTYGVSGFTVPIGSGGTPYDVLTDFTLNLVVPEPSTLLLLGGGMGGLAAAVRARRPRAT